MAQYTFAPIILDALNNSLDRKQQADFFNQQLGFDKDKLFSEENRFKQQFGLDSEKFGLDEKKFKLDQDQFVWSKGVDNRNYKSNYMEAPSGFEGYGTSGSALGEGFNPSKKYINLDLFKSLKNDETQLKTASIGSNAEKQKLALILPLLKAIMDSGGAYGEQKGEQSKDWNSKFGGKK